MEDFEIIAPSSLLTPYIKHYWFLKTESNFPVQMRTVPTGHISLIFHKGSRIFSASDNRFQAQAFLCGHEKVYTDLIYSGLVNMVCVVFRPSGAGVFFKMPMDKINGLQTDIYDLEDKNLVYLQESLYETATNHQCASLIEQFLLNKIENPDLYNLKRINAAISLINAGQHDMNVLANASCLSPRQFNRVFTTYVGAKPKEFQRIIRFQRALFTLQSQKDINPARLAVECGYYDQSHLIKEFKSFSGYTPLEYISECPPHSDYFS